MLHIVDDDIELRNSLTWLLRSRQLECTTYSSGEQLLDALGLNDQSAPTAGTTPAFQFDEEGDCILLDVRMDGMSGIATFDVLAANKLHKRLPVIFITGHGEVAMAVDALKRGAFDFFEKPFEQEALLERVKQAIGLSLEAKQNADLDDRLSTLTPREKEIMDLILTGKMNKVIASDLGISMRTVEVHRSRIFEKMNVKTAVELAGLLK